MPDPGCGEIRRRLALGEGEDLSGHLDRCEGCRREAAVMNEMAAFLREDAVRTPPARVDEAVRSRLRRESAPGIAAGAAACAAMLALVSSLAIVLAERGLAERGVVVAVVVAAAYLALSAAAALPILVRSGSPAARSEETA